MVIIESINNKIIKDIKELNKKKGRDIKCKFIIEGEKYVNSIPSNYSIDRFIFSETMAQKVDINKYNIKAPVHIVKDNIFKSISDTVTPQGILAICNKAVYKLEEILNTNKSLFILMLEEVNDPGNLGTIIRTADSAGVDGIIVSKKSVDIYNRKVLRSTAGSIFNVPIIDNVNLIETCNLLKSRGIKTVSAHLKGNKYPYDLDLMESCAIIIGNEGKGLSEKLVNNADYITKLPMIGNSESLNASIAGSILLYEVVRQRLKNL